MRNNSIYRISFYPPYMGIILFIRRIISIYAIINKPTSGFVAETEHFSPAGI